MRVLTALLFAFCLGSCVERSEPTARFSTEEASYIKKSGTGIITGHAFRTKASGTVVNAAGQVVRLIPATGFARERFRSLFGDSLYLAHSHYPREDKPDPAYGEYTRTTRAEANGRFVFRNVAPGTYIVTTQIVWGDEDALFREGGLVYDTVELTGKESEPVHVILSGY
jgi:hypothetical protein